MTEQIARWLWGVPLLALVVGAGLYLTVVLRGLQFRYLFYALSLAFSKDKGGDDADGDISNFQSLMTALAGTIGIGSIAGVATAMVIGGVGSLFWMVVSALLGMAVRYSESLLALRYRTHDARGEIAGGPMYTIERGLGRGWKWLAVWFAIAGVVASLGMGNIVQANAIVDVVQSISPVSRSLAGLVLSLFTVWVLFGGIKLIGRFAGILVPFMALFYLLGGLVVLAMNYAAIPGAIILIFKSAFTGQAAVGGFVGSTLMLALRMGVARGVFAGESGLGTAAIAASAARSDYPGRQAMISMTGAFLTVCVVCVITGLVIATSGVLGQLGPDGEPLNGVLLTVEAFSTRLPWGRWVILIGAILFAYSTILSWAYYGERCIEYLLHERVIWFFRIGFAVVIWWGSLLKLDMVWNLADIANALMTIPNLVSVLLLTGVVASETRTFLKQVAYERSGPQL